MFELCFEVRNNVKIAEYTFEMELYCDDDRLYDTFVPGQFLHIRIPSAPHLLLRRPISVHAIDRIQRTMRIIYFLVGDGTRQLSHAGKGQKLYATAPVGRGFSLPEGAKNVWLLGGGLGCAPLYTIMQTFTQCQFTLFVGFIDRSTMINLDRYKALGRVKLFTDNGSAGIPGFALDGMINEIKQKTPDIVYACGATIMLRELKKKLPQHVPCQVSLESRMGCGNGSCLVCNCKIQTQALNWTHKRVCVDGPVFPLQEVVFDA